MENLKVLENIDSTLYGKNILPEVGTILTFAGNTAPSGWLLCNGDPFLSASYPELSEVIGVPNLVSYSSSIQFVQGLIYSGFPPSIYQGKSLGFGVSDASGFSVGDYVSVTNSSISGLNTEVAKIITKDFNDIILYYFRNVSLPGGYATPGGTITKVKAGAVPDLKSKYLLGANVPGTTTNISGHVHNASFAAVNTNNVNVDGAHGHNANTTQAANYVNAQHGHYYSLTVEARYVFNAGNKQGTNQGNLSNTDHQHFTNAYGTFGRNVYAPHSHTVANQSVAATNGLSHSHTVAATSGSASIFGDTVDSNLPKTKYLNYIIKGG